VFWSTSRLADLAGTTLRTVRHHHEVGLLAEPERRANGYKRYGVAHLERVPRIKRLTGLGLSLEQIADLGDEDEHPRAALRQLDAENWPPRSSASGGRGPSWPWPCAGRRRPTCRPTPPR
jgi:DNA-binding transcriptional MerR regulator